MIRTGHDESGIGIFQDNSGWVMDFAVVSETNKRMVLMNEGYNMCDSVTGFH